MQNRQGARDRFVQRLGGDLDGMVGSSEITTADLACSEGHEVRVPYSPFVRQPDMSGYTGSSPGPVGQNGLLGFVRPPPRGANISTGRKILWNDARQEVMVLAPSERFQPDLGGRTVSEILEVV